jgi:type VI secretion system protein ImpA
MPAQGEITSREDVIRILDRVCEYMERTEPSSPAPLLIRRAQRLVSRSFVEIIQDLAPESLNEIRKLAGAEERKP